jgi:hypothetical protein
MKVFLMKLIPLIFVSLFILSCSSASNNNNTNNTEDGGIDSGDTIEDTSNNNQNNNIIDGGNDGDGGIISGDPKLASGITVNLISVYQTVAIPVVSQGEKVTSYNSPIIEGRSTTFTVHVSTDANWTAKSIITQLIIQNGTTETITEDTLTISSNQNPLIPQEGFSFEVDSSLITTATSYGLRFIDENKDEVSDGVSHEGRYPQDDSRVPLGVQSDNGGITLLLVPVIYNIDGSGRLPDVSATQLDIIETLFENVYPVETINITLRDAIEWPQPGYENSSFDFGDMNSYLRELKESDNAGQEVYYFALVRPDETFADFCSGTCTTGQSFKVTNPESGSYRVGTGVGFTGERWGWTVLHEMGHMHGRGHARCGTYLGLDWDFPYSNGEIGVWGYDQRPDPHLLLDPNETVDFMSYCDNRWVSDYHYNLIFDRVITVNSLNKKKSSNIIPHGLLKINNGLAKWESSTYEPPVGEIKGSATFLNSKGETISSVDIWGIAQSHTSQIVWAIPPASQNAVYVEIHGKTSKSSTIIAIPSIH